MRRRMIVFFLVVVALVGGVLVLRGGGDRKVSGPPAGSALSASGGGLETRIATPGSITVAIEPVRIDASGAAFRLSFDTHSGELTVDLERKAALVVDGVEWPVASWTGDPPGGHHRSGELRFEATGPATGLATLSIGGLPEPVEVDWALGS